MFVNNNEKLMSDFELHRSKFLSTDINLKTSPVDLIELSHYYYY